MWRGVACALFLFFDALACVIATICANAGQQTKPKHKSRVQGRRCNRFPGSRCARESPRGNHSRKQFRRGADEPPAIRKRAREIPARLRLDTQSETGCLNAGIALLNMRAATTRGEYSRNIPSGMRAIRARGSIWGCLKRRRGISRRPSPIFKRWRNSIPTMRTRNIFWDCSTRRAQQYGKAIAAYRQALDAIRSTFLRSSDWRRRSSAQP